ncbi:ligand-binding sensor domain-containing protein [Neolewinella maritima]|uniref:ligand-binding sensor domain-containing protein n=1 Tax=Neolewinella maritima TaxID=1383882 RepID=UPI001EE961D7|nr:sensor histidine kinase [Neolewinella maritima]
MKHLLCYALLLFATTLAAQSGRIEYFTVTDGLSTREINDLYIGDDGYLWVATMDGLNRFDGHSFMSFGSGALSDTRLSRGAIASISADNDQRLVITFNEFYGYFDRFDPRDFTVEQVQIVPSTGVVGYPRAIVTDHFGRTFVVTIGQEGTTLYEYTDRGFMSIFHEPDDGWLSFAPQVQLLPLNNGQFLLYDEEHGFRHISATGKILDRFFPRTSGQRRFYTMKEGPDGLVYLSFRDGYPLYRWTPGDARNPVPVPDLDDGLDCTQIYKDKLGQLLFLATEDILGQRYPDEYYLLDTSGTFKLFERELPTDRLVSSAAALNFNETTYLGLREGLGVMERYVKSIESYLVSDDDNSLYQPEVRGITGDRYGTAYIIDANGVLHSLAANKTELQQRELLTANGEPLRMREATQLVYDAKRDAVWGIAQPLGLSKGGLLFRYDLVDSTTSVYTSRYPFTALAVDPQGQVFLGASDPRKVGLMLQFDPSTGVFTELKDADSSEEGIRGLRINYLYPSRTGLLLLGTRNRGLVSYNPNTGESVFHSDLPGMEESVGMNAYTINTIYEDEANKWWLGTDAGLQILDPADGSIERYGRQNGLSSNTVVGIVPDSSGGYWLSTHNGLVHLPSDLRTGTYRRYYLEDGLTNDEFSRFSYYRSTDGRYFFGGDQGLSVFRDEDLSSETAGSDVMLTEVVVYGRGETRTITRNLHELEEITVKANEKSVAVSFALPVGQRPSLTQFRVKLEGFSEEWRTLRNERTIRFNNLPGGTYRLLVQGAGSNGNYGEQMRTLTIRVKQYLIEKTWFQFLIALVIVGLFFFILQAKLRERLRNEQLRTQLSSDIHDEVSGLLAGITLQAELLQGKTDDERLRNRLQTVGEAGRNAMSKMSDVIWSIDSRRDTIGNVLQRMQEHADEVLLPLDIRYDFKASGFNEESKIPGNVRQDLYFIYKEAINNIARHSKATQVEIELEQYAQNFEMFIRDNGQGSKSKDAPAYSSSRFTPKTGQGKDNMKMRSQRLRAELTIDDRAGYTLTLRMRRFA